MLGILYLKDIADDNAESKDVPINTTDKFFIDSGYGLRKEYCKICWQVGDKNLIYYKKGILPDIVDYINKVISQIT